MQPVQEYGPRTKMVKVLDFNMYITSAYVWLEFHKHTGSTIFSYMSEGSDTNNDYDNNK